MDKQDVRVILVMGKSGAGKQPRIDCLEEEFGFDQISTGNLFRERMELFDNLKYGDSLKSIWDDKSNNFRTDDEILDLFTKNSKNVEVIKSADKQSSVILGAKAKYFVDSGRFCPNSLTDDIFKNEFDSHFKTPAEELKSKKHGFILDGFPRTTDQAEFLIQLLQTHSLKIDFVLEVDLDDETIVARTTGRRICPKCHNVYHLLFIPPRDGKYCTKCEGDVAVVQRCDDSKEVLLRRRLSEFQEKVVPVLTFLRDEKHVPFVTVSGNLPDPSPTAVRADLIKHLNVFFASNGKKANAKAKAEAGVEAETEAEANAAEGEGEGEAKVEGEEKEIEGAEAKDGYEEDGDIALIGKMKVKRKRSKNDNDGDDAKDKDNLAAEKGKHFKR